MLTIPTTVIHDRVNEQANRLTKAKMEVNPDEYGFVNKKVLEETGGGFRVTTSGTSPVTVTEEGGIHSISETAVWEHPVNTIHYTGYKYICRVGSAWFDWDNVNHVQGAALTGGDGLAYIGKAPKLSRYGTIVYKGGYTFAVLDEGLNIVYTLPPVTKTFKMTALVEHNGRYIGFSTDRKAHILSADATTVETVIDLQHKKDSYVNQYTMVHVGNLVICKESAAKKHMLVGINLDTFEVIPLGAPFDSDLSTATCEGTKIIAVTQYGVHRGKYIELDINMWKKYESTDIGLCAKKSNEIRLGDGSSVYVDGVLTDNSIKGYGGQSVSVIPGGFQVVPTNGATIEYNKGLYIPDNLPKPLSIKRGSFRAVSKEAYWKVVGNEGLADIANSASASTFNLRTEFQFVYLPVGTNSNGSRLDTFSNIIYGQAATQGLVSRVLYLDSGGVRVGPASSAGALYPGKVNKLIIESSAGSTTVTVNLNGVVNKVSNNWVHGAGDTGFGGVGVVLLEYKAFLDGVPLRDFDFDEDGGIDKINTDVVYNTYNKSNIMSRADMVQEELSLLVHEDGAYEIEGGFHHSWTGRWLDDCDAVSQYSGVYDELLIRPHSAGTKLFLSDNTLYNIHEGYSDFCEVEFFSTNETSGGIITFPVVTNKTNVDYSDPMAITTSELICSITNSTTQTGYLVYRLFRKDNLGTHPVQIKGFFIIG